MACEMARYKLGGESVSITVSVGVALLSDDMEEYSLLLRAADAKLYQAKSAGRNRVVL